MMVKTKLIVTSLVEDCNLISLFNDIRNRVDILSVVIPASLDNVLFIPLRVILTILTSLFYSINEV